MTRAFRRGLFAGLIAPLAFVAALVFWIYRATLKVPFPVRRLEQSEVVIRLVDPDEVPAYWRPWRDELAPLFEGIQEAIAALKRECASGRG